VCARIHPRRGVPECQTQNQIVPNPSGVVLLLAAIQFALSETSTTTRCEHDESGSSLAGATVVPGARWARLLI
jgi:hypothetical protein